MAGALTKDVDSSISLQSLIWAPRGPGPSPLQRIISGAPLKDAASIV